MREPAAPFLACAPAHHPWHRRLFVAPVTDAGEIDALARSEARDFQARWPGEAVAGERAILDGWYRSRHGQSVLAGVTGQLWRHLTGLARHAMPAHDVRHAVVLVPAASVLLAHDERIAGSTRAGVLAALLHDQGRWAEARLHGHPTEGVLHARLGFLLAREVLRDTEIPRRLQDAILHAVLVHTSGAGADSPALTRLAVAADMTQLHGPEFALRLVHHLSLPPAPTCFVDESPGTSLVDRFDHFLCQRRDLMFPSLVDARERGLALLWALGEHLSGAAAWEARPMAAQRIRSALLDQALHRHRLWLQTVELDTVDPRVWVERLLDAPFACDSAQLKAAVVEKAMRVPADRRRRLAEALALATSQRDALAADWRARLGTAAAHYASEDDRFMAHIARRLRDALAGRARATPATAVVPVAEHA